MQQLKPGNAWLRLSIAKGNPARLADDHALPGLRALPKIAEMRTKRLHLPLSGGQRHRNRGRRALPLAKCLPRR